MSKTATSARYQSTNATIPLMLDKTIKDLERRLYEVEQRLQHLVEILEVITDLNLTDLENIGK